MVEFLKDLDSFIKFFYPIAHRMVDKRFKSKTIPDNISPSDLLGDVVVELLEIYKHIKPLEEKQIIAFVRQKIEFAITHSLQNNDHLSRRDRQKVKKAQKNIIREMNDKEKQKVSYLTGVANLNNSEVSEIDISQSTDDLEDIIATKQLMEKIEKFVHEKLPGHVKLFNALYKEHKSQKEISELLGVTEARICQLNREITNMAKERLN